jgi:methyl-accepting chemotaxis protein
MFLGLLSTIVLVLMFNRFVLFPIARMNRILSSMAMGGGDLTQRLTLTSEDEIGELAKNFNTFLENLLGMVKRVKELGLNVYTLSSRIDTGSKSISSGARDQLTATNQNFRALEDMNRTIQDVAGSADGLSINATDSSATVTQMTAQVDVVAESTQDLSGHVEEASSSITQMSISVKEVADNVRGLADVASNVNNSINDIEVSIKEVENRAKESARLSAEVSHDAETLGNEAIARTIEGMERIRETVDDASDVIERLGKRSIEIGQIVKVIDEVTNQTSLLALNAAILAAQAGEHGKGFDVVANEIKDLAERTSSSTGEITKLIKSVQKESMSAVDSMRAGKERVLEGAQMAYGASDALKIILESSNRSKETAMGIERATTLQVTAVRQVADAVNNMLERVKSIERATIEQSKGSELIAAAAERISDIAREVRRAMNEQARGIKEFAKSLDDTKDMVSTIADATRTQSDGSSRLLESMETILDIAQSNMDMSNDMERSVGDLSIKAETLRDEMAQFRVSEEDSAV